MKMLCVYCSSSDRVDPKYFAAAEEIAREMVRRGWGLVYGGGRSGLMGAVARTVKSGGGRVVGVIPGFMKAKELAFDEADELITVVTMRERKLLMEARADAFLALPGGWGTLEELMEILTLRQLDVIRKPCVLFNQDGFYDDLLRFFERMINERFNQASNLNLFSVAPKLDQVFAHLEANVAPADSKWFVTN
jgi:cytokinin riboside 5'-monophosphate phosphoribohydrolase